MHNETGVIILFLSYIRQKCSLSYVADMDFDSNRYYALNRAMLSSVGLWPYQNAWPIRIQRFSVITCIISFIIVQLLTFTTFEYNLDHLLQILSYTIPSLVAILKYITYCVKNESARKLMDMIKNDWNTLKNRMEYEIIQKYTYIGVFYAQLFALLIYTFPLLFTFIHFIPNLLDLVAPLNQSRPHQLFVLAEYFVNNEEYFYPIFLHMIVCSSIILATIMSTTSIFVAYIQHTCGMFEIASYRIEHALDDYEKENLISTKCCIVCSRIIDAIDSHRRAIEFFEFMTDTFIIMYFFLLSLGVASLTVNLYRAVITQGVSDFILSISNVCIHLLYFFCANYSGQKILDHSNDFLSRIYNCKWHMIPLHVQKLILFIMQRSLKNCKLLIGGVYVASLEGFATVIIFDIIFDKSDVCHSFLQMSDPSRMEGIVTAFAEMEFLGYRYYKLHRLSLLSLSLWPYGKSFLKQIHSIFCIFLLISSIITQLLKLFTMEYNLDLILTNLSFAIPSVIYLMKYIAFYIQSQKIRELMEQIRNEWNALKDEREIEIIKKYTKAGRRHLYAFAGLAYPGVVGFMLMPALPDILDIIAPLNESRTRYLPFLAEYFLDQQKYFYPLLLHMNVTVVIGIVTVISTETLFFAYVYHICGMFEITGYRIEHALDESMSIMSTLNRENAIRMKMIKAIEIHQRTIEFFEYVSSTFALSYFILIILGVASLSINLFRLFQVTVISEQREDFVAFVIFVGGHFYYMFICNYMGQKIIDNSTEICRKTYVSQWYVDPPRAQKLLLLFMMQQSIKGTTISVGGMFVPSLEGFAMVISYFDLL
ncbi:uncharacterized protein [Anoplolepis gracilipes]|uniref:uncharacterized protein n=1 Tax=Anoplolepis gracilipes TaxID=354296 RepID=UPI003B9F6AA3